MSVPYMFSIAGIFAVAHLKAGNTRCLPVPKACQAKLRPGNNHIVVAMDLTSHSSSRTGQLCWHTTRLESPFRLQYQNLKGLKKGGGKQNSQSGSPVAHQRNDAEPLQNIIKRAVLGPAAWATAHSCVYFSEAASIHCSLHCGVPWWGRLANLLQFHRSCYQQTAHVRSSSFHGDMDNFQ